MTISVTVLAAAIVVTNTQEHVSLYVASVQHSKAIHTHAYTACRLDRSKLAASIGMSRKTIGILKPVLV